MEAELIGRDEELQRVQRFLDGAGARALLIAGEAGVGKTSLWQAAVGRAEAAGMRAIAARPTEAETSFAHAALGDLLGATRRRWRTSPLRSDGRSRWRSWWPSDARRRTSRPSRSPRWPRCARSRRAAPLVVAVDDVQWLDRPTAAVLAFAARRLATSPSACCSRSGRPVPRPLRWTSTGRRPPIASTASTWRRSASAPCSALLQRRLDWVPSRPVLHQVHELSGGNPFFALELGRAVQAGSLHLRPGERLPVTLDALVDARLRGLSPVARRALAVAASMGQPTLAVVNAVTGDDALAEAERAQIVDVRDGVVHFAHPLLASGAYAATDPATRRALHATIAELVDEPEERARHLALAATGPDERVAGALDDAARRAESRGAPAAAADLFERAAHLTPPGHADEARRRTTDAAFCVFQSGDSRRAREMLDEVDPRAERGPARARALVLLALVRGYDDDLRAAEALLREAIAEAAGDAELLASAPQPARRHPLPPPRAAARGGRARNRRLGVGAGGDRRRGDRLKLLAEAALGDPQAPATLRRVARARRAVRPPARHRPAAVPARRGRGCGGTSWTVRGRCSRRCARRRPSSATRARSPTCSIMGAQIDCVSGDVPSAIRHADEGHALTEQTGQATVGAYMLALRALADAIAGDVDGGRERAERALAIAARTNGRPAEHFARAALGLLEQSVGRPAEVVRALGPLVDFLRAEQITEPGAARVVPDQVEALIALGDLEAAEELLGWFEGNARRLDRRSALAAATRCRGLLAGAHGDVEGAVADLRGALALHDGVPIPLELARTRLAYGSALRALTAEGRRARGARGRPRRVRRASEHARGSRWPRPSSAASAAGHPRRARSRRPSGGWPSWSPKGCRPSRSPAASSSRRRPWKATSRTSTASSASALAPSSPTASATRDSRQFFENRPASGP